MKAFILLALITLSFPLLASELNLGDVVLTYNGFYIKGKVIGFEQNKVEIELLLLDGYKQDTPTPSTSLWSSKKLSKKVPCINGFCKNDVISAFNGNTLKGKVKDVFENGILEIHFTTINNSKLPSERFQYWDSRQVKKIKK